MRAAERLGISVREVRMVPQTKGIYRARPSSFAFSGLNSGRCPFVAFRCTRPSPRDEQTFAAKKVASVRLV